MANRFRVPDKAEAAKLEKVVKGDYIKIETPKGRICEGYVYSVSKIPGAGGETAFHFNLRRTSPKAWERETMELRFVGLSVTAVKLLSQRKTKPALASAAPIATLKAKPKTAKTIEPTKRLPLVLKSGPTRATFKPTPVELQAVKAAEPIVAQAEKQSVVKAKDKTTLKYAPLGKPARLDKNGNLIPYDAKDKPRQEKKKQSVVKAKAKAAPVKQAKKKIAPKKKITPVKQAKKKVN